MVQKLAKTYFFTFTLIYELSTLLCDHSKIILKKFDIYWTKTQIFFKSEPSKKFVYPQDIIFEDVKIFFCSQTYGKIRCCVKEMGRRKISCTYSTYYRSYLSIYTALVTRNHSVTMVERLRNWPFVFFYSLEPFLQVKGFLQGFIKPYIFLKQTCM